MIDVTIARANACGSFDRAGACAFFLGAAEEPSDLRLLAAVDFLRTLDMVLAVVGVLGQGCGREINCELSVTAGTPTSISRGRE